MANQNQVATIPVSYRVEAYSDGYLISAGDEESLIFDYRTVANLHTEDGRHVIAYAESHTDVEPHVFLVGGQGLMGGLMAVPAEVDISDSASDEPGEDEDGENEDGDGDRDEDGDEDDDSDSNDDSDSDDSDESDDED